MPLLTSIGAVSLWPAVPKLITDLDKALTVKAGNFEFGVLRWLAVFILVMQGGAGGNVMVATVMTALLFLILTVFNLAFPDGLGLGSSNGAAVPDDPPEIVEKPPMNGGTKESSVGGPNGSEPTEDQGKEVDTKEVETGAQPSDESADPAPESDE